MLPAAILAVATSPTTSVATPITSVATPEFATATSRMHLMRSTLRRCGSDKRMCEDRGWDRCVQATRPLGLSLGYVGLPRPLAWAEYSGWWT